MADKGFGVKEINLIGPSGTPSIDSPNNININATTVAISTDVTIGGEVASNLIVGSAYSVGIGSTLPTTALDVNGTITATSFSGDGSNLTGVSAGVWETTSAGINTISNVGIGSTMPTSKLFVVGDARVTGVLTVGDARVTGVLTVGNASITIDGPDNSIHGFDTLIASPRRDILVEISVTIGNKTTSHRYYDQGSSSAYFLNGIESPFLTLVPGRTYRFSLSSSDMSSHPFRFYLDADKTTQYLSLIHI